MNAMASITNHKNGHRTIQFTGPDGKRRSIRLGKISKRNAEAVKVRVEQLASSALTGHPVDDDTIRWVAKLDKRMTEKLSRAGLIAARPQHTLIAFLDDYIAKRNIKKPNTLRNYRHTRDFLVNFLGATKRLQDITSGDADEWRQWMLMTQAATTVSREVKRAKQFFRAALRKRLIPENPFADLPAPEQVNNTREFFVDRQTAEAVLRACPDAEWRLIFALCRYGGLRCPSEVLRLTWADVDWDAKRITVHASKTEHHRDGGIRQIPIFPELRPYLEEAREKSPADATHVIRRYRQANANLRTQLCRILRRAGLQPWPKLFQNLRASRETELTEQFPIHVVCAWIGNTTHIASKHYLQVTDAHFAAAAGGAEKRAAKSGATGAAKGGAATRRTV